MARKIAVVTGSPREGGNSDMLAEAFIEGAKSTGCEVHRIDAGRADIKGCDGCQKCFAAGECHIDDDMQGFYPVLRECDTLVYATPIYMNSFPATLKAFVDRIYASVGKPFAVKQTGLLLCFEGAEESAGDLTVQFYRKNAADSFWDNIGEVVVPDVAEKGAIAGNPGLDKARTLGASLTD